MDSSTPSSRSNAPPSNSTRGRPDSAPVAASGGSYRYLAGYCFRALDDLEQRRERIRRLGRDLQVRGTVLLAPEGINLFICAPPDAAEAFEQGLRAEPDLADLFIQRSQADLIGFNRFLVKVKREIIAWRRPEDAPLAQRAPTVAPRTLARWLDKGCDDEGRPIALVDTRNAFEIEVGRFSGAIDPGIRSFTGLREAMETHREALTGHRVVTYCTGGIRCEKAAHWLAEAGYDHVVQLDRGVLGYFADVGARHWDGELFVFDRRVSLRPDLGRGNWRQTFPGRELARDMAPEQAPELAPDRVREGAPVATPQDA